MANFGYAEAVETNSYNSGMREGIAVNSLTVVPGDFIKNNAGFYDLAGAGDSIVGVSMTKATFASDNQTVAMAKVLVKVEPEINNTYFLPITGGTVTQADENKYYNLNGTDQIVDGTSESTSTGQLQMVKFVYATKSIFRVVNA
jgi:hypothetical protein